MDGKTPKEIVLNPVNIRRPSCSWFGPCSFSLVLKTSKLFNNRSKLDNYLDTSFLSVDDNVSGDPGYISEDNNEQANADHQGINLVKERKILAFECSLDIYL